MNQIDRKKMVETPLWVENEINILKQIGYDKINFVEIENTEWKFLIAEK